MKLPQHPTIGFIGLGEMGSRMTRNLHKAGYPVIGNDIDEAKCTTLAIRDAVGIGNGWRGEFDKITKRIIDGAGKRLVVKYPELPYFLA